MSAFTVMVASREAARKQSGEFGPQGHSDSGVVQVGGPVLGLLADFEARYVDDPSLYVWDEVIFPNWDEAATSSRWPDSDGDDFIGADKVHYHWTVDGWVGLDDADVTGDTRVEDVSLELGIEARELRALLELPADAPMVPGELFAEARRLAQVPDDLGSWVSLRHQRLSA